jgi:hypothetical protein
MKPLGFCLLLLLPVLAAMAQPVSKQSVAGHVRRGGPAAGVSDAELEKAIRARFAKSKISVNKFQVRVQGGVATIEGNTGIIQHKGTATRLARSAGAVAVVNKVVVSDEARAKANARLAQGRRRAQVKRSEVANR